MRAAVAPPPLSSDPETLTPAPARLPGPPAVADAPPTPLPSVPGPLPDRFIGRIVGDEPGPTVIFLAGVHGNEPAGASALQQVFRALGPEAARTLRGEAVALRGNRYALATGQRYVDRDLNRMWLPEQLERVRQDGPARALEETEQRELDREIRAIVAQARGPVYMLDLHTTSGPGSAFVVLDDTLKNREFALQLPAPIVLGLEEELEGTVLYHFAGEGFVSLGFESGQHQDPAAVNRAEAAVWLTLEAAGSLATMAPRSEPAASRRLLEECLRPLPSVVEVRYRHAITPEDRFRMREGFVNFQVIREGQVLADDDDGPVEAPMGGLMLMPLYQAQGDDGFFLVKPVRPLWLKVSARLRRLGLERFLHHLPGVRRHPEIPGAFQVDRRVARWYALELFHLLGFRRWGEKGRELALYRRPHDS